MFYYGVLLRSIMFYCVLLCSNLFYCVLFGFWIDSVRCGTNGKVSHVHLWWYIDLMGGVAPKNVGCPGDHTDSLATFEFDHNTQCNCCCSPFF